MPPLIEKWVLAGEFVGVSHSSGKQGALFRAYRDLLLYRGQDPGGWGIGNRVEQSCFRFSIRHSIDPVP